MRIPTKMTLALGATGLALFGAYAVYLVRAEDRDLKATIEREANLLAKSLQVSVENALRDRQMADVQETLQRLDAIEPNVDIVIYDPAGRLVAQSKGSLATDRLEGSAARRSIATGARELVYDDAGSPRRLVVTLPLVSDLGQTLGALAVARPLEDVRAEVARTRRDAATSVLFFALAATVVGLILGRAYIGRPMRRLVSAMTRVREGRLESSQLPVGGNDEVGEAAREFNAMLAELAEARRRLSEEAARRRTLEQGLQEADKLITIGQLAASLAHEIGSPLQVLVGRARALASRDYEPDRARHHAEIIARQGERITGIVEQLLTYARRRPAVTEPIDPRGPVRSVLDLLQVEGRQRGVAVTFEADDNLPDVPGDPNRIQQVVFNLLRNALNATSAGGHVKVRLSRASLVELPGRSGVVPGVALRVEDDGQGIAPENLERVFEPFFTTRADAGGVGLGLAVVKAIVGEHGGRVSVTSEPGRGSRFLVELPCAMPAVAAAPLEPAEVEAS